MNTTAVPTRPAAPRWLTIPAALLVAGITIVAFVVSYHALRELAALAGFMANSAAMWPLIVDGIIVLSIVVLFAWRDRSLRSTWTAWVGLIGFTAISLVGNGLHTAVVYDTGAGLETWVAIAIGAVPPAGLAYSIHLLVGMLTTERSAGGENPSALVDASSAPAADASTVVAPVAPVTERPVMPAADDVAVATEPLGVSGDAVAEPARQPATITTLPTAAVAVADDVAGVADQLADATADEAPSAPAPVAVVAAPSAAPAVEVAVPKTPADQVAWVVGRQRTHGDVTWQLIAEHLGLSTRQAQRRLTDARKADALAFAA